MTREGLLRWAGVAAVIAGAAVLCGTSGAYDCGTHGYPVWGSFSSSVDTSVRLAVDPSGDAMAVWAEDFGNVQAGRYDAGTGWERGLSLGSSWPQASDPDVAVDPAGNAIGVWIQDGDAWWRRYEAGTGWSPGGLLESGPGPAAGPAIAMDGAGNATAAWIQEDDGRWDVWASRYTAGGAWTAPALIESDDLSSASGPVSLASDPAGNAVAVWIQSNEGVGDVWANRHVAGSGWGTALKIEGDPGAARQAGVGVDDAGNAIAVWSQTDGTRYNIRSARFEPGPGWGAAQLIESADSGDARHPAVAVGSAGDAVAAWEQWDGSRFEIRSSRWSAGPGWSADEPLDDGTGADAGDPSVAVDSTGNAFATWQQRNGSQHQLLAARFPAGTGWTAAEVIDSASAKATGSCVAAAPGGAALAAWGYSFTPLHGDAVPPPETRVAAIRYVPGSGWEAAEVISQPGFP